MSNVNVTVSVFDSIICMSADTILNGKKMQLWGLINIGSVGIVEKDKHII